MSELASLLPLVGIALLFWLLLIRPAQRRQREMRRMQSALAVGDEVMLTSGIYATVRTLADDSVEVEVSPGVVVRVARGAVGSVVPAPGSPGSGEPSEHPERSGDVTDSADTEER